MSEDLTKKLLQSADEKLTLVLSMVQGLTTPLDRLEVRFDNLEQKVDETRPILQKLVTDVAQLQEGQSRLETGQRHLEEGQSRLETGQRHLEEGQSRLETGQRHLEEGQRRLEEGQEALRSEVQALRGSVDYRFMILSGEVLGTCRKLHERVSRIELHLNLPNTET